MRSGAQVSAGYHVCPYRLVNEFSIRLRLGAYRSQPNGMAVPDAVRSLELLLWRQAGGKGKEFGNSTIGRQEPWHGHSSCRCGRLYGRSRVGRFAFRFRFLLAVRTSSAFGNSELSCFRSDQRVAERCQRRNLSSLHVRSEQVVGGGLKHGFLCLGAGAVEVPPATRGGDQCSAKLVSVHTQESIAIRLRSTRPERSVSASQYRNPLSK